METIWYALEDRYKDGDLVKKLMSQVVNMFIVDLITSQSDRHYNNWMIVEEEDNVYLQPMFDNSRIYMREPEIARTSLVVENSRLYNPFLEENIIGFLNDSSNEFISIFKNALNVLEPGAFDEMIKNIEKKTNSLMPEALKKELKEKIKIQKEFLTEIISSGYKRW